MSKETDLYKSQYLHHQENIYRKIRVEAFGIDIGQNSWITAGEQDEFITWLNLNHDTHLLDIACGSGETTLRMAEKTGCAVTGVDIEAEGIATARKLTYQKRLGHLAQFIQQDGSKPLPFEENSFDVITCIDAINHLPERRSVLSRWYQLLKPGGKLLFTDPITVTGILSREEIIERSSIGYFLFSTPEANKNLLRESGFTLIKEVNHTSNTARTARGWWSSRRKFRKELIALEGEDTYNGKQDFLNTCALLAEQNRLSRMVYLSQKPE